MLSKKLIALSILVAGLNGIAIIDLVRSNQKQVITTNSSEILRKQPKYTEIVAKVDNIAAQITVGIATSKLDSLGSGVILARQGKTYYVLTAGHVIDQDKKYKIVTPDGKTYRLDKQNIVRSDAYDLAILSFESEQDYTVATIGNYAVTEDRNQAVFVSGFANLAEEKNIRRIITGGKVFGKLGKNLAGLMYRNISYPGMNGGAILDREGRLVGINLGADEQLSLEDDDYKNIIIGFSSGIPIYEDILGFLTTQTQFKTEWLNVNDNSAEEISDGEWNSITSQLLNVNPPDDNDSASSVAWLNYADRLWQHVNPPDDNADSVAWLNYGNQLWRYEKYSEAIAALEKAVEINPHLDRAYYTMGLIYEEQREITRTIQALEKAVEINPDISPYWHLLGASYSQLNSQSNYVRWTTDEYKRIISVYKQGLAADPQNTVLYLVIGWTWRDFTLKGEEEAIASISKAIEINPNLPRLYNERADIYKASSTIPGRYKKAIADYDRAISLNPLLIKAYNNRGNTYYSLEQYDKAIADYDKVISFKPKSVEFYKSRANAYKKLEQYDKALADYTQIIALKPKNTSAYYSRAVIYRYQLKEYDKALADYTQIIALEPENASAYMNLSH